MDSVTRYMLRRNIASAMKVFDSFLVRVRSVTHFNVLQFKVSLLIDLISMSEALF